MGIFSKAFSLGVMVATGYSRGFSKGGFSVGG